jgi:hypothetical protein
MLLTSRRHPFYRALQVRNTLRDDIGIGGRTVQVQTVINQLRTFGLGNFRPNRASQLTTADDAARLKWANWVAEWDSVLFGDVSRFDLHSDSGRVRVWRRSNEQYLQRCIQTRVPFRSGSVMQASTLEGALISMFVEGMSKDYDGRHVY